MIQTLSRIAIVLMVTIVAVTSGLVKQHSKMDSKTIEAKVVLHNDTVRGVINFEQTEDMVKIYGQITGLPAGEHGFHVHQFGNLSDRCAAAGAHLNPHGHRHGAPSFEVRHVGDLGNIVANLSGVANVNFYDEMIALSGDYSIIGKALVLHARSDDLGLGGNNESLTTGNAGGRIACGVIELSNSGAASSAVWRQSLCWLAVVYVCKLFMY